MSPASWATVILAVIAILGLAWQGGQLVQILRELRRITSDHEDRIRLLEARPPQVVTGRRR